MVMLEITARVLVYSDALGLFRRGTSIYDFYGGGKVRFANIGIYWFIVAS